MNNSNTNLEDPYGIWNVNELLLPPWPSEKRSAYHPNYNPEFPQSNGGVPHWMCLNCKVGLKVIEYCLQCPNCGLIVLKNLHEGWNGPHYPVKKSSYDYKDHFKTWMDCILARENITPTLERVINDVKNEWMQYPLITCIDSVRHVLKNKGHNKHYKHAPLILKKVSGVCPPELNDNYLSQCKCIFSDVMEAYKFCFDAPNSAGYPYIIYKILDMILPHGAEPTAGCGVQPRREILDFIYLQSQKTIAKRDKEWEIVLEYITKNIYKRDTQKAIYQC